MKRFWQAVSVDDDGTVRLDERPVRTPGRAPLALPTASLAALVAAEWAAVGERVDPRAMPLTGFANAAIDRIAADPDSFASGIARYGESDLLCYRAETPTELAARQAAAWDPLLAWARERYDVHFAVTQGIVHVAQPEATVARLRDAVAARDPFALAALQTIVALTGTLIGTLALADGAIGAATLWHAATIDEAWQREQWGDDALAAAALADRRRSYDAAAAFLAAVTPPGAAFG